MKKTCKIALAIGIPVSVITAVGIGLYRASVHEQICLSYEGQTKSALTELMHTGEEADNVLAQVQANPFAALGFMNYSTQMMDKMNKIKTKLNDTKYAYVQTCGESRFDKFISKPDVKFITDTISAYGNRIQSRASSFGN